MERFRIIFVFCFVTLLAIQVQAQETLGEFDDTTALLGGLIFELEDDKTAMQAAFADPNMVVFFHDDGWVGMPKSKAIEMANRLLAIAELEPRFIDFIMERMGIPKFLGNLMIEQSPELVASQIVSRLSATQNQVDAYLQESDGMISDLNTMLQQHLSSGSVFIPAQVAGVVWNTTYGDMTLRAEGDRVVGSYSIEDGTIVGQFNGSTLVGMWVEPSSARSCSTTVDGSKYWGRIEFTFNEDYSGFSGRWNYCDADPSRSWTGSRK